MFDNVRTVLSVFVAFQYKIVQNCIQRTLLNCLASIANLSPAVAQAAYELIEERRNGRRVCIGVVSRHMLLQRILLILFRTPINY